MHLSEVKENAEAVVIALEGGTGFRKRAAEMGFIPGQKITVVRNASGGPVIIHCLGTRVMLGRGMARKICVRETNDRNNH